MHPLAILYRLQVVRKMRKRKRMALMMSLQLAYHLLVEQVKTVNWEKNLILEMTKKKKKMVMMKGQGQRTSASGAEETKMASMAAGRVVWVWA